MSETKALPQDQNEVTLSKAPDGRDEMTIHVVWWFQWGGKPYKVEFRRRYRAASLGDLLRIALSETDSDGTIAKRDSFKCGDLKQVIRDAVFDAQDAAAAGGAK